MMERMFDGRYFSAPATVGKYRPEQIAHISTWARVPDSQARMSATSVIHAVPENGSTVTYVNPLDPGDQANSDWYAPEGDWGAVKSARSR